MSFLLRASVSGSAELIPAAARAKATDPRRGRTNGLFAVGALADDLTSARAPSFGGG
jgi:hypothetical protein